jgi:hypothetical protein
MLASFIFRLARRGWCIVIEAALFIQPADEQQPHQFLSTEPDGLLGLGAILARRGAISYLISLHPAKALSK